MSAQLNKCQAFSEMHRRENAWLIPNPWDVGSARVLQGLGFEALATTSSGFAYTLGRSDGSVSLEEKLAHCRQLCTATSIPVNADFENGFSDDCSTLQDNVRRMVETGVAGLSIEDFSRDSHTLYSFQESVERIQVAAESIKLTKIPVLLTARAENLLRGVDDLDDTIRRLQAYSAAGADVLYAPGINSLDQLREVCAAIDKPFNVLAPLLRTATVAEMSAAGATRISTGGALSWAAVNPLLVAGKEMLQQGTFAWLSGMASSKEVRSLLDKK
ncbi:MAG: isocitrate lyase/phosphoenolpyruvate mutase family protein [Proteobacteria bacterium]|nr:isocitrate lyase/phosphoenolpyruvate mutase family protein [Pseudomonadota bacterium]